MNNQSVTLLSILYRCNPQDEDLSRESKLQSILHSAEYQEVSKRAAFAEKFQELFAAEKLRTYSAKQLANVTKVLPLIPTALEDIAYSLQNGAAPTLTKGDAPDFMDKDSLERLISKLHDSTGKTTATFPQMTIWLSSIRRQLRISTKIITIFLQTALTTLLQSRTCIPERSIALALKKFIRKSRSIWKRLKIFRKKSVLQRRKSVPGDLPNLRLA